MNICEPHKSLNGNCKNTSHLLHNAVNNENYDEN